MSPAVTGISQTRSIIGCGEVSLLNTRQVDTGAVRIKDGETLVLTGVIQDQDIENLLDVTKDDLPRIRANLAGMIGDRVVH